MDPICTLIFAVIMSVTTLGILKEIILILLEGNSVRKNYKCNFDSRLPKLTQKGFRSRICVNIILILACTCGNSTACVCYLNWKPVAPPPPKQTDGPVGKTGLRSANTKHLEAVAMMLITPNRGT